MHARHAHASRRALLAGVLVGLLAIAVPNAARAAAATPRAPHVPGAIVVKYRPTASAASTGGHAARPARPHILEVPAGRLTRRIRELRSRPDVAYAVPDYIAHAADVQMFDDPGRGTTPGGWAQLQWNFVGPFGVDATGAWNNVAAAGRPGGSGVVVAVLDTGIAYRNHGRYRRSPDLRRARFVAGRDFVSPHTQPDDANGHGTHVASTIAETANNGIGVVGLAYRASIMPVRVLNADGEGRGTRIARGIRWAARHGAQIINLSLEFSLDVRARDIPEIISALRYAHHRGVLVVGAAGNEAEAAVAYPARNSHVLSVGATTVDGCIADYSNDGHGLDLVAPGGGDDAQISGDPYCRPLDPGPDIYQMTYTHSLHEFGLPSGYEGTSMAAPHVSATAALVIASGVLGPHPSPQAVTRRLEATARDLGAPGYDVRYGWGLIDAAAATATGPPERPAPPPPPATRPGPPARSSG